MTRTLKILAAVLLVTVLAGLDAAVVTYWDLMAERLGAVFGFELGLAIFLNVLGALFVLDFLEDTVRMPGLRWFYDLPSRRSMARRLEWAPGDLGPARCASLLGRTVLLALVFYVLETLLFPFLPAGADGRLELALIAAAMVFQLAPAWRASRAQDAAEFASAAE